MILLDTHVWVWWVQGDRRLPPEALAALDNSLPNDIVLSVISCWEVAMLHARKRVEFSCSLDDWLDMALAYPSLCLIELSRRVAVAATRLPGEPHRDPADRMLIATALELDCPIITADERILGYPHVRALSPDVLRRRNRQ